MIAMKKPNYKITFLLIVIVGLIEILTLSSCEKYFLEKRIGSDLNVDSIFASRQKALSAIASAYVSSLSAGIPLSGWDNNRTYSMRAGTLSGISGEICSAKFNWEDNWLISHSGLTANDGTGIPRSSDAFGYNYTCIRECYTIMNNIDKVPDMTATEKKQVKAEMKALIAYRYEEMFKRYGGIPLVNKILSPQDSLMIPRSSLQQTMNEILSLCSDAETDLPDNYNTSEKGRATKGFAKAIRAELYMFASRPLFNSAAPYLTLAGHNDLICFGKVDNTLWQKAIDANEDVISWSLANGYQIINTGNPFDDYGTAVATPSNPEVLMAYQVESSASGGLSYFDPHGQSGGANGMSYNQLTQYYKADGTEQTWAGTSGSTYSDYLTRFNQMEPRFLESAVAAGQAALNNPGSQYWATDILSNSSNWDGRGGTECCGRRCKFWYHAGTRSWFEYPIYRLAEFYLNLAEAYNEIGNTSKALSNLNVIRKRAGLPDVTETDQSKLRGIIQREWSIEFYEEGHRYFDVKHWKLAGTANGIIGGSVQSFLFTYQNGDYGIYPADYITYYLATRYTGFWNYSQYLEPFPVAEINKGYITQNPGY